MNSEGIFNDSEVLMIEQSFSGSEVPFKAAISYDKECKEIESHLEQVSSEKNYESSVSITNLFSCDRCNFESEVYSDLERHKEVGIHSQERLQTFCCDQCANTFISESNLNKHIKKQSSK